jgi:hypothetical protein
MAQRRNGVVINDKEYDINSANKQTRGNNLDGDSISNTILPDDDDDEEEKEEKKHLQAVAETTGSDSLVVTPELATELLTTMGSSEKTPILVDDGPVLLYHWILFYRLSPAVFIFAIPVVALSAYTQQYNLAIAYAIIWAATGFGLIVIGFLKFYILVFFFLVLVLAETVYTLYWIFKDMPYVYHCGAGAPYCHPGKKWEFNLNFVLLCLFVGYFIVIMRNCLIVLEHYY